LGEVSKPGLLLVAVLLKKLSATTVTRLVSDELPGVWYALRWHPEAPMISARAALIFAALALTACSNEEKESPRVLIKEAFHVMGTCSEDHVSRRDDYAGLIVRSQSVSTGGAATYGFVQRMRPRQYLMEEMIMQPNAYHPPTAISFVLIDVDTSQRTWVLHGISERGEDGSQGYNSTCNVEVVERSNKVWDAADIMKWLEQ
jgi:hypothetical protein